MPPPLQVVLCPFDLENGVRVTCDVGYLCVNFSLPMPHCSRFRPYVRDRQTPDRQTDVRRVSSLNARLGGAVIITTDNICRRFITFSRSFDTFVSQIWFDIYSATDQQ